jgi:hypothetical protein
MLHSVDILLFRDHANAVSVIYAHRVIKSIGTYIILS